jgi:hypothetical protein
MTNALPGWGRSAAKSAPMMTRSHFGGGRGGATQFACFFLRSWPAPGQARTRSWIMARVFSLGALILMARAGCFEGRRRRIAVRSTR